MKNNILWNNHIALEELYQKVTQEDSSSSSQYAILTPNQIISQHIEFNLLKYESLTNIDDIDFENDNIKTLTQLPKPIFSYSQYINNLWQAHNKKENSFITLLSSLQQEQVFYNILDSVLNEHYTTTSAENSALMNGPKLDLSHKNLKSICQGIMKSWMVSNQYNIDNEKKEYYLSNESRIYFKVIQAYKKFCQKNQLIDNSQIETYLSSDIQSISSTLVKKIYFIGFTHFNKQQEYFLSQLQKANVELVFVDDNHVKANHSKSIKEFHHPYQEIESIILEAIEHKKQHKNNCYLGVYIADLHSLKDEIAFQLQKHSDLLAEHAVSAHVFTNTYAIENRAFIIIDKLLSLSKNTFEYHDFSQILCSAFIWDHSNFDDLSNRHYVDKLLREILPEKVTMKSVLSHLLQIKNKYSAKNEKSSHSFDETNYAKLIACLGEIEKYCVKLREAFKLTSSHRVNSYYDASLWLSALLYEQNWFGYRQIEATPSNKKLISSATNSLNILHQILDDLSSLSLLNHTNIQSDKINISTIKNIFYSIASKTKLYENHGVSSQLQFHDINHSVGLEFDKHWCINLNHRNWPPKKEYFSFLPFVLIEQSNNPFTSNKTLQVNAQSILSNLINKNVAFSYSKFINESEVSLSPMLYNLLKEPSIQTQADDTIASLTNTSYYEDYISDNAGEILCSQSQAQAQAQTQSSPDISVNIPGGSRAIKNQIACPFKAWVENRLALSELNKSESLLQPKIHGIAVHEVLEIFWKKHTSSDHLQALFDDSNIDEEINAAINIHLSQKIKYDSYQNFPHIYRQLLASLIKEWLSFELTRDRFVIKEQEKFQQFKLGKGVFSFRPDRIDQIEDNVELIIDYKTGSTNINQWFGKFIEEPQLPIYLLMYHEQNQPQSIGIAYANLKSNEISLQGISPDEEIKNADGNFFLKNLNKISFCKDKSYEEIISYWKQSFEDAIEEFINGHHPVTPTKKACNYCHYASICRINNLRESDNQEQEDNLID